MKTKAIRENSFGFLIQTLARDIDAKMKLALKEVDVDTKIFANLMVLSEEDGIKQRTLGEKLNFPEYFTSRNVDALVAAGFAERQPDPESRRSFLIFLTDAGRKKAAQLPSIVKQVNDDVLSELNKQEKSEVILLLQKVAGIVPS
ncbi:MarR family winged helix-turn-helix transcriptional regulator [Pseudovibrio brasiliensis]|uniref:MarR family transcriptional regulator n=1 Tax=Pseudovibrio brasiliensis TaxID=1898042 RepID=A0ABX8AU39_9HYPH|nr:MarR family transcriptional regulator [Pseudovibrio brasiliensis]QUS57114.1 MarR family transcriptional regulator [Pseudovibrio brasiliensis]